MKKTRKEKKDLVEWEIWIIQNGKKLNEKQRRNVKELRKHMFERVVFKEWRKNEKGWRKNAPYVYE